MNRKEKLEEKQPTVKDTKQKKIILEKNLKNEKRRKRNRYCMI